MTLKERLLERYGVNQPIFLNEIRFDDLSSSDIRKQLFRMTRSGEIARYMRGVYYFPQRGFLLSPYQIIEKRYLHRDAKPYGFYSGANLRNLLGLSTQVPFISEVTTNAVKRPRLITVNVFRFLLLPPRVKITNRNLSTLQLLNVIEKMALASFQEDAVTTLTSFIERTRIKKSSVLSVIPSHPKTTLMKLENTGLFDVLA